MIHAAPPLRCSMKFIRKANHMKELSRDVNQIPHHVADVESLTRIDANARNANAQRRPVRSLSVALVAANSDAPAPAETYRRPRKSPTNESRILLDTRQYWPLHRLAPRVSPQRLISLRPRPLLNWRPAHPCCCASFAPLHPRRQRALARTRPLRVRVRCQRLTRRAPFSHPCCECGASCSRPCSPVIEEKPQSVAMPRQIWPVLRTEPGGSLRSPREHPCSPRSGHPCPHLDNPTAKRDIHSMAKIPQAAPREPQRGVRSPIVPRVPTTPVPVKKPKTGSPPEK